MESKSYKQPVKTRKVNIHAYILTMETTQIWETAPIMEPRCKNGQVSGSNDTLPHGARDVRYKKEGNNSYGRIRTSPMMT